MKRLLYLLLFLILPLTAAGKVFDFGTATSTHTEKPSNESTTGSYHNHHQITETGKLIRISDNSTVILGGATRTTISASDLDLGDASSQTLIKGSNVHLGAEYVFSEDMERKDARNFKYRFEGEQRGVHTAGDGDLAVIAQGKLTGTAAQLHSGQGDISLYGASGDEILNFDFESHKGLQQRQQLEKDYYSYSGTGEVYPSYPEDWVMLGHGLLRNLPKNFGKQAAKGVDDLADDVFRGFNDSAKDIQALHRIGEKLGTKRTVAEEGLKLREIGYWHRNNRTINYDQVNKNTINVIRENRAKEISHQFNSKNIHPRDMTVTINGKTYKANPITSTGAPVYQGVSENNVFAYFKEITGTTKLPQPKIVPDMTSINGNLGQVWTVVPTEGPLKGSTINLRTFSQSQNQTNAKFTIEITNAHRSSLGTKAHRLEIKFE